MIKYNKQVNFYNFGCVADKKINYITAIGRFKNQWVLIRKKEAKNYEFPGGKKLFNEKNKDALIREVKEEIGASISRAIPLSLYSFIYNKKDDYGIIYYCEFTKLSGKYDKHEISEIKLTSRIEKQKISSIHLELLRFVLSHRRIHNAWFHSDTRESFGRAKIISVGKNSKKIKQSIADPMDITRTIKGFFEGYVKGQI